MEVIELNFKNQIASQMFGVPITSLKNHMYEIMCHRCQHYGVHS
jgi:hypothetical protein